MLGQFSHEHREMIAISDAILAVARTPAAGGPARLTELRLQLSRLLMKHCSKETALIDRRRGAARDPHGAALLKKYHDDLLQWRHDLVACNADWPPARVFAAPAAFTATFGEISARLRARVEWEEREFYPGMLHAVAA